MKILLLLVLIVGCSFGAYKFGIFRSAEKGDVPAEVMHENSDDKRVQGLEAIAKLLQNKGAQIIDKRVFDAMPACEAAIGKIASEYQRRGINANNVVDGTAFMGAPGKAMVIANHSEYYYLACLDFAHLGWAGYIQYKLTQSQLESFNNQQATQ